VNPLPVDVGIPEVSDDAGVLQIDVRQMVSLDPAILEAVNHVVAVEFEEFAPVLDELTGPVHVHDIAALLERERLGTASPAEGTPGATLCCFQG
jgi:hypothetical protein